MGKETNQDWREGLLKRIRNALVPMALFSGFVGIFVANSPSLVLIGVIAMIASLALILVLSVRRIPLAIRSVSVMAVVSTVALIAYLAGGFLAGPATTITFALIVAALLSGRRSFIALLVLYSIAPFVAAYLVWSGYWHGPSISDFDPTVPITWIRSGLISIVMWASVGFSVLFVKDTIEGNLAQKAAALTRLRAAEQARSRAEETVAQAQKLDAVGRLAAGIAHDFNNALLVVQGWNELRANSNTTDFEREAGESIDKAVQHGTFLARQLLTFARKDVRSPRALSIDDVVADTTATLRRLLPANIELHVDTASKQTVFADEAQLQQVIINIAINSRDALPEGGEVSISTRLSDPPKSWSPEDGQSAPARWVAIEVTDDGVGMDEQVRELVFEPFFTTKERGRGTGLGLATSYGIVRQSSGHVTIQSAPGQGTTVTIYLPAIAALPDEESASSTGATSGDIAARTFLVEDSPEALKFMIHMMEAHGMTVTARADGDSALEHLASHNTPYELLVCDAVFPGAPMSDVLAAFRKHSPDAPILICSGYVREGLAIPDLESSNWDFLAKPFGIDEFIEKIRSLLGN